VLTYPVSHRDAHQSDCPLRSIQCLVCKSAHSLLDSKLAAHIELFLDPSTRTNAAAQVAALCRSGQHKPVSRPDAPLPLSPWAAAAPSLVGPSRQSLPLEKGYGRKLRMGDKCDCLDTANRWRRAEIVSIDGRDVRVHYVGWSTKVSSSVASILYMHGSSCLVGVSRWFLRSFVSGRRLCSVMNGSRRVATDCNRWVRAWTPARTAAPRLRRSVAVTGFRTGELARSARQPYSNFIRLPPPTCAASVARSSWRHHVNSLNPH
jgi:hypothetical protein